jgi:hypothetical protein
VVRGPLRLLRSGPSSSSVRATSAEVNTPGHNRIHMIVEDLDAQIQRLHAADVALLQ